MLSPSLRFGWGCFIYHLYPLKISRSDEVPALTG